MATARKFFDIQQQIIDHNAYLAAEEARLQDYLDNGVGLVGGARDEIIYLLGEVQLQQSDMLGAIAPVIIIATQPPAR